MLEELAVVQEEADKLDTMLNAVAASGLSNSGGSGAVAQPGALANNANMLYLSTWLLYHVLRQASFLIWSIWSCHGFINITYSDIQRDENYDNTK